MVVDSSRNPCCSPSLSDLQNEYFSNIILDGLRADHQGTQPGVGKAGGGNIGGFGDAPPIAGHSFAMADPGPIWKQTQQFGDAGGMVIPLFI